MKKLFLSSLVSAGMILAMTTGVQASSSMYVLTKVNYDQNYLKASFAQWC